MRRKITRRDFLGTMGLVGVSATAIAMGLTACSGDDGDMPTPPSGSSSSSNGSGSSSSGSSSSSSSSGSSDSTVEQQKIIWSTETKSDGSICITGYDTQGAVPSGSIVFPSEISGRKVTEIDGGFGPLVTKVTVPGTVKNLYNLNCENLQEAILQEGVERIGYWDFGGSGYTFYNCKMLTRVQLPSTLKKIDEKAFSGCTKLKNISLPQNLEYIGSRAFAYTGLTSITVPASVTELYYEVFYNSDLESATVQGTTVEESMFECCENLKSVTLNKNLTEIPRSMFHGCTSLTAIQLPTNLSSIGMNAFQDCTALSQIMIPAGVSWIGMNAFQGCVALQKMKLPYGITTIETRTFEGCTSLRSIYIPSTVMEVEYMAFEGCNNLRDVYYQASSAEWQNVSIKSDNAFFTAANIHFNSSEASY